MSYTRTILFKLGESGLSLKAALYDNADAIHATFRDVACPEKPPGSGIYRLASTAWPDGYRGEAVAYVGTVGVGTTFGGVTVKDATAVNPGDYEKAAALTGTAVYSGPTEPFTDDDGNEAWRVKLVAGDAYESDGVVSFTFTNYTGPSLAGGDGEFRMSSASAYRLATGDTDAPAELVAAAVVTQDGTTVTFTAPLTAAQTDNLSTPAKWDEVSPTHRWQAVAFTSDEKPRTLGLGDGFVRRRIDDTVTP